MDRSYVEVTAANASSAKSAKQITDHANWDRYLTLIQGQKAYAPVKFNGQAFTCNNTGHGWDYRGCGAAYWWQNTRQPYYNVLAQGDYDSMRAFLGFYRRMLPYVQARTAAQFKGTSTELRPPAALYPETTTQFGTYTAGDWGCKSPVPRKYGASDNGNVRFHWTGSLELSLMVLDLFDATGNLDDLRNNLPIAVGVVEAYRQRFPNKDQHGKTDFFPAQVRAPTEPFSGPCSNSGCRALAGFGGLRVRRSVRKEPRELSLQPVDGYRRADVAAAQADRAAFIRHHAVAGCDVEAATARPTAAAARAGRQPHLQQAEDIPDRYGQRLPNLRC